MTELIDEFWVAIPKFENYEVSNYGEVVNTDTGRTLRCIPKATGHVYVGLCKNGNREFFLVARLVAQAFFLNYAEDVVVKHKNGILSDNTVLNLTLVIQKKKGRKRGR